MKLFNIHIVFILTFPLFDRVLLTILSDSKGQRFKAVQLRGANSPRSIYQNSKLIPRSSLLFLRLLSFSLCSSLFWEFRDNEIRRSHVIYRTWAITFQLQLKTSLKMLLTKRGSYYFSEECESGLDTHGGNSGGNCCVFPFKFRGKLYHDCTTDGYSIKWCSTTYDFKTDKKWGLCY